MQSIRPGEHGIEPGRLHLAGVAGIDHIRWQPVFPTKVGHQVQAQRLIQAVIQFQRPLGGTHGQHVPEDLAGHDDRNQADFSAVCPHQPRFDRRVVAREGVPFMGAGGVLTLAELQMPLGGAEVSRLAGRGHQRVISDLNDASRVGIEIGRLEHLFHCRQGLRVPDLCEHLRDLPHRDGVELRQSGREGCDQRLADRHHRGKHIRMQA